MVRCESKFYPGQTYHVLRRGKYLRRCFTEPIDFVLYLDVLQDALLRYGVFLHAYVMMATHVHLLLTPSCEDGVSGVLSLLDRRDQQCVGQRRGPGGAFRERRHVACVANCEHELFCCYRHIDLNPVAAGIVKKPSAYYWSSYACNALGVSSELVTPHPKFLSLGYSKKRRCAAYRALCRQPVAGTGAEELPAQIKGGPRTAVVCERAVTGISI